MIDDDAQARCGADTPSAADAGYGGPNPAGASDGAESNTATQGRTKAGVAADALMEQVVERGNMWKAYERVLRNKGAPGADGMPVQDLKAWLQTHWLSVKAALLAGRYLPREVRAVDIPKPSGGVRTLGVPSVVDRLIQQALFQVLQPIFESGFSESSYGFRPGRNAWQAVQAAREHVKGGRGWVADIDLAKFFDRVNHDKLMARVAREVKRRPSARSHPQIPRSGTDARWGEATKTGRHAARRPTVTVAEQHCADGPGSGTGAAGACLCPLRG